ncbi:MAG: hypothetical protein Kow0080_26640 [Candidatus Promineifilaceae bacterium]
MSHLHIRLFGPLQLHCQGKMVVSFPTRYVAELLSYLLVNPAQRHAREKVVTLLWPDCGMQQGRARLSTTLWRLRHVFSQLELAAEDFVLCERDWVSWQPSRPFTLDITQFNNHLLAARRTNQPQAQAAALETAASLYHGEFCEGLYTDWCLIERERYARAYLATLGQLMQNAITRHAYTTAIDLGQAILEQDPLREEVHRALIICYGRNNQPAQAAKQFQQCAHLLQTELGIMPMPETIAAFQQVLSEGVAIVIKHHPTTAQQQAIQTALRDFQKAGEHLQQLLL